MKTLFEEINSQVDHLVFRLDLIPESEYDKKALNTLDSKESDVTDDMIRRIVEDKAREIRDNHKPDWDYKMPERKVGTYSFYVHLNPPSSFDSTFDGTFE